MVYCKGCLEKQRRIDELEEKVRQLEGQLRYQQRKTTEGPFGSSTPLAWMEQLSTRTLLAPDAQNNPFLQSLRMQFLIVIFFPFSTYTAAAFVL